MESAFPASRVALISAMTDSLAPIKAAFAEHWPEARLASVVDESLETDRARGDYAGPSFEARLRALAEYAASLEVGAVLFTCSAFAGEIGAVRAASALPVRRPDEALLARATERGEPVCILITFEPTRRALELQLDELRRARPGLPPVRVEVVPGALAALRAGKGDRHDELIAARAAAASEPTLALGQYSMTRAAAAVAARAGRAPLSGPACAVAELRATLGARTRRPA